MLVVGSYSFSVNISSRLKSLLSQSFVFEFLWPPVREKSHFRPNRMLYCSVGLWKGRNPRQIVCCYQWLTASKSLTINPSPCAPVWVCSQVLVRGGKKDKRGARITSVLLERKKCVELWNQWELSFHKRLICAHLHMKAKEGLQW